ncbi:acyl-CoA dehydrogenase family protein [Nesterenkonia sp. HG001]|uniref:acyl-CoA dehydrogenase family protein n=1 Tax=Nesterenkonia sp. HG001 TaxID=2983207 RepID=UPI002AC51DB7|nr:acyl-CoA dehydrogenase family protein [Nesterenkonia sp. HG001]MDZ5077284.1 acyl-CoA dehydrogenase family protein [Nesterenkonia sp. HG001]
MPAEQPTPTRRRTDLMAIESQLSAEEIGIRDRVAEFVDRRIRPHIARWYEDAVLPTELFGEMAELGLFGMHLTGYGCAGRSATEYGLAMQELEAGDSGIRTVVSVQGSLAMSAIHKHGSEEQKQQWLPGMAAGEMIGCFGLTEPTAGSDPGGMATRARREGDEWVLTGSKRWIGLATIADVAIIWAKVAAAESEAAVEGEHRTRPDDAGEVVRGFIVPTDTLGFRAEAIERKLSMRASLQCDITLEEVRLPAEAILPKNPGLRGPFGCLSEARYGIAWGAMGAARDALEAALDYAAERQQFGRPLSGYQLTQKKFTDMALELTKGQLLALQLGRAKDAGTLENHMISVGKLNNCRAAIEICREARTIFGGNGITAEHSPLRHANNLESVRTYEGTDEVHTLIIGQRLTGEAAFR